MTLSEIQAGFQAIAAEAAIKSLAAQNLFHWLTQPEFAAYKPQLDWLLANAKWSLLLDSFYQVMPFGTGGRRGAVGIGPNRMNLWTLGASVQGHCEYLRERFPGRTDLQVVVAYDVRRFLDTRSVHHETLPNSVRGPSSKV